MSETKSLMLWKKDFRNKRDWVALCEALGVPQDTVEIEMRCNVCVAKSHYTHSVLDSDPMKVKILKVLENQIDGFIIPNQTDFKSVETHELFWAIDSLIEDGILRKRNCEGLAYEMVPSLEARVKAANILCSSQDVEKQCGVEKENTR